MSRFLNSSDIFDCYSLGGNSFSRAYINFAHVDDIINFRERFDGYVFVDAKGMSRTVSINDNAQVSSGYTPNSPNLH